MVRARTAATGEIADYVIGLSDEEIERKAAGDIALLDDPTFNAYKWSIWRLRTPDEMAREPQGGEWEHVATKIGPLDEEWTRANLGGGTFEFRGYFDSGDGNGRNLKRKPIIPIAGPRKNFAAPTPSANPAVQLPANNGLTRGERILLKMARETQARLERLEHAPAPAPPAPQSLKDLVESLVAIDTLRARNMPAPQPTDTEMLGSMMEVLRQGIEIGQVREPAAAGEGGTDWLKVAEAAMPVIERVLSVRGRRMAPPPGVRTGSSSATVIETPPPPAAEAPAGPENQSHRWETAFESLAGAIAENEDPADFAVTLERILNTQELAIARLEPDQLIVRLKRAAEVFPILATLPGQAYIAQVLQELNQPPEAESDDGAKPSA